MQFKKYEHLQELPANPSRKGEGGLRTRGVLKTTRPDQPLVTIVTSVFNGDAFLEDTIQSILNQDYGNLEYIIIDGGSTDRTVEILKKYEDRLDYWVSEKDAGISDAFNKGVMLARGEYINFQGDGDGFVDSRAVTRVMAGVDSSRVDLVGGRIRRVDLTGKTLYESPVIHFRKQSLLLKMSLPHQGLFTHIRFFKNYGLFDPVNKFAMDYEHLLRAYRNFPETRFVPAVIAQWRADGVGNGRTMDVLREYDAIKRRNEVASPWVLSLLHAWIVFKFRIKTVLKYER